jgi:hypothetical protein
VHRFLIAAQHEVVRCRHRSRVYSRSALDFAQVGQARLAWIVSVCGGPGSAVHRFARFLADVASAFLYALALHRIRDTLKHHFTS